MPASANVDEDFVAAQFDRVALDAARRLLRQFAGCDVVLPAVPWTTYHRAVKLTITQRPTVMQTYTTDCK